MDHQRKFLEGINSISFHTRKDIAATSQNGASLIQEELWTLAENLDQLQDLEHTVESKK